MPSARIQESRNNYSPMERNMKRVFLATFSTCAATLMFFVGVALPLRVVAMHHEAPVMVGLLGFEPRTKGL